jgi:hypothetical protein
MTHPLQRSPKEKAEKLVDEYYSVFAQRLQLSESFDSQYRYSFCKPLAKRCAEILVREILATSPCYPSISNWEECGENHQDYYETHIEEADIFWRKVWHEIEKL